MADTQTSPQTRETIEFLSRAASELAGVGDLETLASVLQGIIGRLIIVEFAGTFFIDPETGAVRIYSIIGFEEAEWREAERTAMDRHPGKVIRTGKLIHVPDTEADPQQQTQGAPRKGKAPVRSRLFLPVNSEGRCVGTMGLASTQPHSFSELHISVLNFACQVAGVIYKKINDSRELKRQLNRVMRQEQELRRLASPVIELWERVLALPLIGTLNEERFAQITESLLTATVAKRAKAVIIDLTGIEALDAVGTQQVVRLCRAITLLGSRCLLSGISPATARGLALFGDDLSHLQTFSSLRQALAAILRKPN